VPHRSRHQTVTRGGQSDAKPFRAVTCAGTGRLDEVGGAVVLAGEPPCTRPDLSQHNGVLRRAGVLTSPAHATREAPTRAP